MSGRTRPLPEPSAETLLRDDQLLDALGRGESPGGVDGDMLLLALSQWRADIGADLPTVDVLRQAVAIPDDGLQLVAPRSRRPRARRTARLAALVAVITAVLGGGLTAAAAAAQPGSLLWPITEIVYGDHAASVLAERDAHDALAQARQAIAQERFPDAETLLAKAEGLIAKVRSGTERDALDKEFTEVQALLSTAVGKINGTPATPSAPQSPGTSATPATPAPGPTASPAPGGLPLPLPSLPLPSLPLPSLTLVPLPSLPHLPLGH